MNSFANVSDMSEDTDEVETTFDGFNDDSEADDSEFVLTSTVDPVVVEISENDDFAQSGGTNVIDLCSPLGAAATTIPSYRFRRNRRRLENDQEVIVIDDEERPPSTQPRFSHRNFRINFNTPVNTPINDNIRNINSSPIHKNKRTRSQMIANDYGVCSTSSSSSSNYCLNGTSNSNIVENLKKFYKCSICLDVVDNMTSTICGHVYCNQCIRDAIMKTKKCPLCLKKLKIKDIHSLYL